MCVHSDRNQRSKLSQQAEYGKRYRRGIEVVATGKGATIRDYINIASIVCTLSRSLYAMGTVADMGRKRACCGINLISI